MRRIPRSLLVCEGNTRGNNGSSWTVPVFVLGPTQFADEFGADEDQIPPNGNPHPLRVHLGGSWFVDGLLHTSLLLLLKLT